jgi:DNA-binding YbaB/EbfC family protein
MKNISQMMQQAQKMQEKMEELQANLNAAEIIGVSGGGMVEVVLTGKGMAKRVKINPSMVILDDVEILEDLITAAINDARNRIEEKMKEEMSKITGGLGLPPGMNLPF